MSKAILALIFFGILFLGFFTLRDRQTNPPAEKSTKTIPSVHPSISPPASGKINSRSLFVPYWNLQNIAELTDEYDKLIYFGISVNESGVNRSDQGFANMQSFSDHTSSVETLLTVRMLDADTNIAILEDETVQKKLAGEIADIAETYDFAGVVLDLELSVIPFTDVKNQITRFTEVLDSELEARALYFGVALYGDTYYRARPYDVKKIATHADEILIMAYDFHKSRGEPGPNFPFTNTERFGYDFRKMIQDFSGDVAAEKITVIFGMYGYNWTLGKQGLPLKTATAFSLNDAKETFYPDCRYQSCTVNRDTDSAEMKVTYTDTEGYKNEAWFEDEESVQRKTNYLKENRVDNVSYWVNGYF